LYRARRSGFTLLEVLLASALAVVLMAALYVALDVQLRLANEGREAIEQATLTRAIVQRLENDLTSGLGPVAPPVGNAGGGGMGGAGGGAAGAGGAGGGAAGAGGAGAEGEAVTEAAMATDVIPFQAGVIGDQNKLTIFIGRVAGQGKNLDESGEGANPPDIRRVTYWLTDWGLARQEIPWVTSDRLRNSTDPDIEDGKEERDYVIAEEVTNLVFEYWDGSAWAETWDGRQTNADGQTLRGPPMAIRVRFWLKVPGSSPGEVVEKEFRHTIVLPAAPGPAAPDTTTAPQQ
jgi:prepilin-type N-terminal cleavage/methylation domain-containing protein